MSNYNAAQFIPSPTFNQSPSFVTTVTGNLKSAEPDAQVFINRIEESRKRLALAIETVRSLGDRFYGPQPSGEPDTSAPLMPGAKANFERELRDLDASIDTLAHEIARIQNIA